MVLAANNLLTLDKPNLRKQVKEEIDWTTLLTASAMGHNFDWPNSLFRNV